MAERREDIAEFALLGGGIANSVSGEKRKMEGAGDVDGDLVAKLLLAVEMALEFNVNVSMAEDVSEPFDVTASFVRTTASESMGERAFGPSGKTNKAGSMFAQVVFAHGSLAFVGAQLHLGVEATEILVSEAGGDEKRKTR